jgi:hypothetical protein
VGTAIVLARYLRKSAVAMNGDLKVKGGKGVENGEEKGLSEVSSS